MNLFFHLGRYYYLLSKVFAKPEDHKMYFRQTIKELDKLGIHSAGIVAIISFFLGAVVTIQTAYNLNNPMIPKSLVGVGCRDSMILEFSSTIVGLILAGKVGSNVSTEIGTMRVTEQIDALEIMGVNSASYLIMPKIAAMVFINPFLSVLSIFVGIIGGFFAAISGAVPFADFMYGIHYGFQPFYVYYTLIKAVVFAFIITSVSSYHGYFTKGGALEVGRSSTKAVVYSSVLILLFNLILTHMLLTK